MKNIITLVTLLLSIGASAQVQHPALLSIQGIGGNNYDFIYPRVVSTDDGGFIIRLSTSSTGSTGNINTQCNQPPTQSSSIFRKYDATGNNLIWEKCFTSGNAFLFPKQNGNFITGGWRNNGTNSQDYFISELDVTGGILWIKYFGGSATEFLRDMVATNDGGYIMLGISSSKDGDVGFHYGGQLNMDIWALKVDSNGNKVWSTVIGGTNDEEAFCVVPIQDGGCYIVGSTYSADNDCISNHGLSDVLVTRLNNIGGKIWSRCYGGSNYDASQTAWAIDNGLGGLLFTTHTSSTNGDVSDNKGGADFWLVNVDSNNNVLWNQTYGSSFSELPYSICMATDQSIWLAGSVDKQGSQIDTSYGGGDAWIMRADNNGNFLSGKVLGADKLDKATLLYPLAGGTVLVGGTYEGAGLIGGDFPATHYGLTDVFLARFAPWTTNINSIANDLSIDIYPNPAKENLFIQTKQKKHSYGIRIIGITGNEVFIKENITGNTAVDVSSWSKGLYYLQATGKDGSKFFTKVLIN